jgi:hypothetical protein
MKILMVSFDEDFVKLNFAKLYASNCFDFMEKLSKMAATKFVILIPQESLRLKVDHAQYLI